MSRIRDRVAAHGLTESSRERRNPREVLEEIQGDPLGREDGSAVSFDAQERLAGCCTGAVFLHHRQGERSINSEKGLNGGGHPCDDEVLLRNDPALSGYLLGKRADVVTSPRPASSSNPCRTARRISAAGRTAMFRSRAEREAAARCWSASFDRAADSASDPDARSAPRRRLGDEILVLQFTGQASDFLLLFLPLLHQSVQRFL